ncbi:hypothetical protein N8I77_003017 [Diaporthe amygdali]|uniref:2EXR domain-containing protein n=1 Tax=Phomopsis amygdali TaxID=1214568 RepID=A0AAD9W5B1_PHOAM|nr:hypothetical protein N8I77_003017 [Diaporthe amygdali]
MIWEAALVPRVIVLKPRKETSESDTQQLVDYSIIPGILYANWESRSIALKHYDQKLALTFTKWAPVEADSAVRTTSRIPIIMAACDEIAFSSSHIGTVFAPHDVVSISIDTAPGAPEPWIRRFSLLGDKLTSYGIDTEHLARLLNPESFEYDCSESADIFVTQTIDWVPFNQWHEIGLSEEYPEGMDTLCVHFELAHSSLDSWLSSRFNSWCRSATYFMDRDGIHASVLELPNPLPHYYGRL